MGTLQRFTTTRTGRRSPFTEAREKPLRSTGRTCGLLGSSAAHLKQFVTRSLRIVVTMPSSPVAPRDRRGIVVPERAEDETGNAGNLAEFPFLGRATLTPLTRHEQPRGALIDGRRVRTSQMVRQWRKTMSVKIVLDVTRAAMHRPELMPHRRTLRRVLVDDQVIDKAAANPVAPLQRRISEWRPEHIAASHSGPN